MASTSGCLTETPSRGALNRLQSGLEVSSTTRNDSGGVAAKASASASNVSSEGTAVPPACMQPSRRLVSAAPRSTRVDSRYDFSPRSVPVRYTDDTPRLATSRRSRLSCMGHRTLGVKVKPDAGFVRTGDGRRSFGSVHDPRVKGISVGFFQYFLYMLAAVVVARKKRLAVE